MPDLTLDDIARMAGVSPSTVSRVLNNLVGTRSKAREQVLKVLVGSLEPYASQERLGGYRKALADRGLPIDEGLVAVAGLSNGYGATRNLLQHAPDAIFFPTRMALDVVRALREASLRAPDDIALIGFEDLPLAQQTDPPLTTVSQPMGAIGKRLVGMLLDIMENGAEPPRRLVFPQELVIRQSCGALRA